MTSTYQILLNNGKTVAVSLDLFEKLPQDSMLHNLLKADQEMAKKDEDGNYLLKLDHPDMFEFALQSIEKPDLNCYDLHSATRASYPNFLDAMKSFVSTLDYLQFPIPKPYKPFMSEYASFMLLKRGEIILEMARKQVCDMALSIQKRMIQKAEILLRNSLQVAEARKMNKEFLEMQIFVRLCVQQSRVIIGFDHYSDLSTAEWFETTHISNLEQDFKGMNYSPIYVVFKTGSMKLQPLLDEYFFPVFLDTFCKINSLKLVSVVISKDHTTAKDEERLIVELRVDLRE
jgi:hypothetical protein